MVPLHECRRRGWSIDAINAALSGLGYGAGADGSFVYAERLAGPKTVPTATSAPSRQDGTVSLMYDPAPVVPARPPLADRVMARL
jgi:hypothetical protein